MVIERAPYFESAGINISYYLSLALTDDLFYGDDYWWDVYNNLWEIGRDGS